jgi:LPXTG-motif cell wall-anchored protein
VSLGQAVVGADGTFSATVTVPKDLANGTHHLVASGVDANGNPRYLVVEITVSGGTASGLAYTGFSALPYAGAGVLALLAGGGLLVVSRRRQAA